MMPSFCLLSGGAVVAKYDFSSSHIVPDAPSGQEYFEVPFPAKGFDVIPDGDGYAHVEHELTDYECLASLRQRRNLLLVITDQSQTREDYDSATKALWAAYRQELRDWPENESDVHNPTEPVPPSLDDLTQMQDIFLSIQRG